MRYILSDKLDDVSVLVWGYDPEKDSKYEYCAVFSIIPEEQNVRLENRHRRSHFNLEDCQILDVLTAEELSAFDKAMPRFYKEAMRRCSFTPFDDSIPVEQQELPLSKDPP